MPSPRILSLHMPTSRSSDSSRHGGAQMERTGSLPWRYRIPLLPLFTRDLKEKKALVYINSTKYDIQGGSGLVGLKLYRGVVMATESCLRWGEGSV